MSDTLLVAMFSSQIAMSRMYLDFIERETTTGFCTKTGFQIEAKNLGNGLLKGYYHDVAHART